VDAELADWLSDRYPGEMTVVMQHWYDALEVGDEGFSVTLNFGDAPEPLYIPYDAIKTFVDPSVEFGLRFESASKEEAGQIEPLSRSDKPSGAKDAKAPGKDAAEKKADIVSLDSFRKS
jgi:hypothetical protein